MGVEELSDTEGERVTAGCEGVAAGRIVVGAVVGGTVVFGNCAQKALNTEVAEARSAEREQRNLASPDMDANASLKLWTQPQ